MKIIEFIKKYWAWLTGLIGIIDVAVWLYEKDWSVITTKLIKLYEASLEEITMPWWGAGLLVLIPLGLLIAYDHWKTIRPIRIKITDLEASIIKHWQEHVPRGHVMSPYDLMSVEELGLNLVESRKQLIILNEKDVLRQEYLDDEHCEYVYSMRDIGYKA
jgi:hypothetical protein